MFCFDSPGVNFINILLEAFTLVDPKSVKKIDNLSVIFTHLGSVSVKAGHKTLLKLNPDVRKKIEKEEQREKGRDGEGKREIERDKGR